MESKIADDDMKAMWEGQSNVFVAVRVRPLLKHDIIKKSCVKTLGRDIVIIRDPACSDKQDVLRANRNREKQYAFDQVFDQNTSQDAIYKSTSKFLIHGVLDGYNATVLAYGQTGSGKTYTMIGSPEDPGIMVRIMHDLFLYSEKQGQTSGVVYKVSISFLEVYNENIRDLLSETEEYLDLREDPIKGPMVAGITEIETSSTEAIMALLLQGNNRRSQAATAANEVSSRSHAVLQVIVECRDRAPGVVSNIKVGKLSLVDLAGSERAANTKNTGVRLVEGANINRSLLALGNCINALSEKGNKGNFVPYRDSKLTRLLKDSLGGNCRTVMIANISSADSSYEETLNTLKYANRAKNIRTTLQRNVMNVNYHISEYVHLIDNLRSEIKLLKDQISSSSNSGNTSNTLMNTSSSMINLFNTYDAMTGINSTNTPLKSGLHINTTTTNIDGISNGRFQTIISPIHRNQPQTPLQAIRETIKTGQFHIPSPTNGNTTLSMNTPLHPSSALSSSSQQQQQQQQQQQNNNNIESREIMNNMRQRIVENFQERMQLRRSLIELEDQNVQNTIEVSKRQLMIVQWVDHNKHNIPRTLTSSSSTNSPSSSNNSSPTGNEANNAATTTTTTTTTSGNTANTGSSSSMSDDRKNLELLIQDTAPDTIQEAWTECEQLRKAVFKNNTMKKNIAKRLRNNEREAELFREELTDKITGEDRRELMELQYQVGRLELDNMELEQHRIVHESVVKGKDLVIQKLLLQLAVKDKLLQHQMKIIEDHDLIHEVNNLHLNMMLNVHAIDDMDDMTLVKDIPMTPVLSRTPSLLNPDFSTTKITPIPTRTPTSSSSNHTTRKNSLRYDSNTSENTGNRNNNSSNNRMPTTLNNVNLTTFPPISPLRSVAELNSMSNEISFGTIDSPPNSASRKRLDPHAPSYPITSSRRPSNHSLNNEDNSRRPSSSNSSSASQNMSEKIIKILNSPLPKQETKKLKRTNFTASTNEMTPINSTATTDGNTGGSNSSNSRKDKDSSDYGDDESHTQYVDYDEMMNEDDEEDDDDDDELDGEDNTTNDELDNSQQYDSNITNINKVTNKYPITTTTNGNTTTHNTTANTSSTGSNSANNNNNNIVNRTSMYEKSLGQVEVEDDDIYMKKQEQKHAVNQQTLLTRNNVENDKNTSNLPSKLKYNKSNTSTTSNTSSNNNNSGINLTVTNSSTAIPSFKPIFKRPPLPVNKSFDSQEGGSGSNQNLLSSSTSTVIIDDTLSSTGSTYNNTNNSNHSTNLLDLSIKSSKYNFNTKDTTTTANNITSSSSGHMKSNTQPRSMSPTPSSSTTTTTTSSLSLQGVRANNGNINNNGSSINTMYTNTNKRTYNNMSHASSIASSNNNNSSNTNNNLTSSPTYSTNNNNNYNGNNTGGIFIGSTINTNNISGNSTNNINSTNTNTYPPLFSVIGKQPPTIPMNTYNNTTTTTASTSNNNNNNNNNNTTNNTTNNSTTTTSTNNSGMKMKLGTSGIPLTSSMTTR